MATWLESVVFDAHDMRGLASWWAEALGWTITLESAEEVAVEPAERDSHGVPLVFVPVADPKVGKNRVHLDLHTSTEDGQAALVERLTDLGARPADIGQDAGSLPWVVLADPEGNELCVLEPRARYADTGPVAAIVIDAAVPPTLAGFWNAAINWPIAECDSSIAALRHPDGYGPFLEFIQVDEVKAGKNRLHLDIAPDRDGNQSAEIVRLRAHGATPADIGQGTDRSWVVLADPEGNEFCVLSPRP